MKRSTLLAFVLLLLALPLSADYIVGLRFRNFVAETNATQYLKAGDTVQLFFTTRVSATNPIKDLGSKVIGGPDLKLVDGGRYVEYKVTFPDTEAFGVVGEIAYTPVAGLPDPVKQSNGTADCRREGTQIKCGAFITVVYGWGWDWCKGNRSDPVCAHFCAQHPANEYCR